jgi:hypothetical protein
MGDFDEFDAFVERHHIQPNELGAAFAAWLNGTGWDGDFEQVQICEPNSPVSEE